MIIKLFRYIGSYKKYAILAPILIICEVLLEIYIPFLMSEVIDVGIARGDTDYIIRTCLFMLLLAVAALGFGAFAAHFAAVASTGFAKNIRERLFHKISDFSFANIDKFSTASLVTRQTTDITFTQMAFMMTIRMLVRAPVMLIAATLMAVNINTTLSSVFLAAIPVLAVLIALLFSKAYPRFRKMFDKYDDMNASVQENLIAMRVVKAFVRREYENKKFVDSATVLKDAQKKAEKLMIIAMPLMMFTMYACIIAVLWFGGGLMIDGAMGAGDLMSFLSYIAQILMSLMMISMVLVMLVISRASVSRISEILDEKIDITDDDADKALVPKDGSIEFRDVCFSYTKDTHALILDRINLSIKSGQKIGIIGGTGSAKTTLVSLIPRLYDITSGELLVGGHSVKDYTLHALREDVAMVLQKNVLFSGTIRENLKWGNEHATDTQIIEACKAAQAHDFISSFPDGYETMLDQGGGNVSGGQKQRLCIARALLKNPKIIILDDSTSAVDTKTDSEIQKAFAESLSDITTIIIAQRINSVMAADQIIVLNDGKIDAIGTHGELLDTNEIYKEVYTSQQKGVS